MYKLDKHTVSLLHFDEDFTDETGKVWTAVGTPTISADQSKFGGKSLYLDGISYIKTGFVDEFDLSTGDFTIDWWEYRTDSDRNQVVFQIGAALVSGESICVSSRDGNVAGFISSNGSTWNIMNAFSLGSIDLNKWNHFALVRGGKSLYTFKNGTLTNSLAISSDTVIKIRQSDVLVGSGIVENASSLNFHFNGYIDEFRISNIARWTENFDPELIEDNSKVLLRITMNDSSEREYELSISEVEAFITWCNRTVDTGDAYYVFDKAVGSQNSKEYLFFEKIISFEVIEIS